MAEVPQDPDSRREFEIQRLRRLFLETCDVPSLRSNQEIVVDPMGVCAITGCSENYFDRYLINLGREHIKLNRLSKLLATPSNGQVVDWHIYTPAFRDIEEGHALMEGASVYKKQNHGVEFLKFYEKSECYAPGLVVVRPCSPSKP